MTTGTATTTGYVTATSTAANKKHISETGTIHNKIAATSKRYELVRDSTRRECAGSRVSEVRVTGPAKN